MDAREKSIIERIANQLQVCSRPPFKSAELDDWAKWANSMQSSMKSTAHILEGLIETNPDEQQKQSEEDFLNKNLEI